MSVAVRLRATHGRPGEVSDDAQKAVAFYEATKSLLTFPTLERYLLPHRGSLSIMRGVRFSSSMTRARSWRA